MHAFREELKEVELTEREVERDEERQRLAEEKTQLYKVYIDCHNDWDYYWPQSAYVDELEGTILYLKMFEEDSDADRIKHLPELKEMLQQWVKQLYN